MRNFLTGILFIVCLPLFAQSQTVESEDSLRTSNKVGAQLYIAPSYSLNQFVETGASFAGIHAGVAFNNGIDFGFSYSRILDNFTKQIIFPSSHMYDQSNVGVTLQYSFLNKKIRPHVGADVQYVIASWEPAHDSNDNFTDQIFMYSLYGGAKWMMGNVLSLQVNIGYNYSSDVEITGIQPDAFDGLGLDILLKIRVLNFQ